MKPNGYFLFDYLNEPYVRSLTTDETEFDIEGVLFRTRKEFDGRTVIKHIEVVDGNKVHHFSEQVNMYQKHEIVDQLQHVGFSIEKTLGNYDLQPHENHSPRLIVIAKK